MTEKLFATLYIYQDSAAHSAAMNMAIDEALLESASIPSLRFYRWQSPALSFGYFGKFADVANYNVNRDLVRRWTGGGIVLHGDDVTYSIIIPSHISTFADASLAIYEEIHRALADALNGIGERAVVAGGVDPGILGAKQVAVTTGNSNCFANPVRADVMVDGRKVAGAAQRRTRAGLLQQGSIQGIKLANGLTAGFANALSGNCSEVEINQEILKRARELAHQKYGTNAWLRLR